MVASGFQQMFSVVHALTCSVTHVFSVTHKMLYIGLYDVAFYHFVLGFSGGNQPSLVDHSQLPFPAASQTHLRSGPEGRLEALYTIRTH